MSTKYSCNHVDGVNGVPLHLVGEGTICNDCDCCGPNLWMCIHKDCFHIGCSENFNDHSTIHFKQQTDHCVHVNLSTKRIWCYICESEVFLRSRSILYENSENEDEKAERPRVSMSTSLSRHVGLNVQMSGGDSDDNNSSDSDDLSELAAVASAGGEAVNERPRGLVGLQNIGNTCYMNSALQALSNTPPLTSYFLDCGVALQLASENKKPGLSRTYQRLVKEIWNKKTRGCVVPSGILYGIRNVYPMFRGYHQHDTQEFLRCFMDQLHEELKEPCSINPNADELTANQQHSQDMWRDSPSPSQSEGEYETCDSGVSERSSLSDDTERTTGSSTTRSKFSTCSKRRLSPDSCASTPTPRCKLTTVQYSNVIDTQPSNSVGNIEGIVINKQIQKTPLKYRSVISDLFDGKLLSSVQCLTCDRISTRVETFQDLSLPIPGRDHITMLHQSGSKGTVSVVLTASGATKPINVGEGSVPGGLVACADSATREGWWSLGWLWGWLRSWFYGPAVSLHDCLAAFFSADELKGDNMYSCEKCNKLRNGVKFSKVIELPEVLCIHLKRFRHELMFSSKISNQVAFPMKGLDMRPYLHRDCVSGVSEYDLSSVICHHGTAGGGHYTCYALNQQRGSWFEFDDQYVTQVSPETVECCEAYVLFYRKCTRNITTIRQRVIELTEMQGAGDMRFYVSRQWYTRFSTCAEPGPIDNSDFLCVHSAVRPNKMSTIDKLSMVLSQPVWEYLQATFGGGPTCNHLYECPICGRQAELHDRRIRYELETFSQLNREFQQISSSSASWDECNVSIYAISMRWLRCWQAFVRNQTEEPPGPIDNTSIVMSGTSNVIKLGSDYAQISEELWFFLYRIYGGGPPIQLRCGLKESLPIPLPGSPVTNEQLAPSLSEEKCGPPDEMTPLVSALGPSSSFSSTEDEDDAQFPPPRVSPVRKERIITFTNPPTARLSNGIPGSTRPPKVYVLNNSKARRRRAFEADGSQKYVHNKYSKYNGKKLSKAHVRLAQRRSPSCDSPKENSLGHGEVIDQ